MLNADKFKNDPRLEQAKQLVIETLKDHQSQIKGPRPSDPSLKISYDTLMQTLNSLRGNPIWHPYLGSGFGKGALVELLDGSIKYDFISGIGVHFFGHSNPLITEAAFNAALSDTIMEGHLQQNKDVIELSELLSTSSKLPHCFISSSGAMANENALKIAFQKRFPARRILAFERCFVGRTLAISQITDKPYYREGISFNLGVDYIPFFDAEKPEESTERAVTALKKALHRYPGEHAVMVFELIQGEGGCYPGSSAFFKALIEILKEHKIVVFFDEVQTFGRTASLFAFQHYGLQEYADIVSIGKLSQVCATLFTKEMAPKPNLLSQTFIASVSAIQAGTKVIKTLLDGNFYGPNGRMEEIQALFRAQLSALQKKYPDKIKGPWGIGAMFVFTYEEGDAQKTIDFSRRLFEAGLIAFVAGASPTRIRMLPPAMDLTNEDIEAACRIIETCL